MVSSCAMISCWTVRGQNLLHMSNSCMKVATPFSAELLSTFSRSTMVCDPAPDCSTASTSSMDCTPSSPKDSKKSAVINSLKLNIFDKKRVQNNFGSVMQNWFDFNDSRVTSILVKDIEKQFSGKESAYMLFYRRKSLARPLEARGNPRYMMPEKLVEEENAELEKLREEYELAINLQVHLGNIYKCTIGVLEPKPNEMNFLDLRDSIFKATNADLMKEIENLKQEIANSHEKYNNMRMLAKKKDDDVKKTLIMYQSIAKLCKNMSEKQCGKECEELRRKVKELNKDCLDFEKDAAMSKSAIKHHQGQVEKL